MDPIVPMNQTKNQTEESHDLVVRPRIDRAS